MNVDESQNNDSEWKNPDQKEYCCMIPFIRKPTKDKLTRVTESRSLVALGEEVGRGITKERHKETSGKDGFFHSLQCADGFMDGYVHRNFSSCLLYTVYCIPICNLLHANGTPIKLFRF